MLRCNLADYIKLPTGEILKPVIGGHLDLKPFLTLEHSGVDLTNNGWSDGRLDSQVNDLIVNEAKRQRLKYRRVSILSKNLRGKLDLRNQFYRPQVWVYVQVK